MAKSLSILFITSEVLPFAKTGGLADVSAALPLALTELGHDVRLIIPKYGSVSERRNRIHEIKRLKEIPMEIAGEETIAVVKSSQVVNARAKVQVYLVTNDKYLEPLKGIYTDPKTGKDFANNDERFIFFAKAALETCLRLGWRPDVIHCNDWQTALIPMFMKEMYGKDPMFAHTRTLLTIHNMAYQGVFPAGVFAKTGLPAHLAPAMEHAGKTNFLKAGIVYADAVNTVSPRYAKEIMTSEYGCGLESVVKKHGEKLWGIVNGVDTEVWNPATDKLISEKYTATNLEAKFENKTSLGNRFAMDADLDTPIFGMIARLVEQKGYDLICESIDKLAALPAQFVFMGEGDKKYETVLTRASKKYKNIGFFHGYDEELAHLVQAGSDAILMPSRFEPCGLNQLYAQAYGSVPVVAKTGGLLDTIEEYNPKKESGNGFFIEDLTTEGLVATLQKVIELFRMEEQWETLVKAIMAIDNSWKASAEEYVNNLYRKG